MENTQKLISTPTAKPEAMQIAEQLMLMTASTMAPVEVGSAFVVNIPPGYTQKDITDVVEKAAPTPRRKRGTVRLGDVDSLLAYCADQISASTAYIYADPDARTITAVFNDHRAPAGWRDHRALFAAEYTPEFKNWLAKNKTQMGQTDFAEFIEDNIVDLHGTEGTALLNVATTLQASTGINFSSARRLQDGQTQITYNEVIDAKAGADGSIKIPQTFTLALRIFKNGGGYKMTARLKYRLHSGAVKFWYELERPEKSIEDAFAGYVADVREKSGYAVLIGRAD